MTDYLVSPIEREERKKKEILTENRMVTINKRETSYQGLAEKFEGGEDELYNLFSNLGKTTIFEPKNKRITERDIEEVPGLKELRQEIEKIEKQVKTASGRQKYLLKKWLIQMRQDQYILKNEYRQPLVTNNMASNNNNLLINHKNLAADEDNSITVNEVTGEVTSNSPVSLYNAKHISALLCNYSKIKQECNNDFMSDAYYIIKNLDNLVNTVLKPSYPLLFDILVYKIKGMSNQEIQSAIEQKYNIKYSVEHISFLWRNKIPKLLAQKNQESYLLWYYTYKAPEKAVWKTCSKCGKKKLANNVFFPRNSDSKDGWYSICKECRNKKIRK